MESTDCYTTQEVNDPCEEEQDNTSEEVDDDLCPEWPDGGMVCPVTGCGTKFYGKLTTYWGHWKRKHHEQLRQLYCPKCPHKSLNKKYFATHLTRKHRIKMPNLDQVIASVHTELIPNKEFIPPGSQRCPKRKSVNSESKMGTKRLRIKLPSQDSQCKQDEDNFSMTTAETDVKVSICNVAKDVSSVSEIERLPITPSSEMGQKEKSDKNISYTNETSRNDNISHSQQSKTVTVCLPTEAQNISVSDAESERGISDSRFIMEMEKEKSEAAQIPDNGCHEGGMRCHVPACGSKHFDTLNSYKAHWKRVHSDTFKEFKCPLCSFKQSEKLQLHRHLRLKHKVDKTALQTMLSIVTVEVLPNQQYIDPGTVQCPIGKVHDLSGSEGETKRPRLSAAQQASGREKQCTEQTDFSNPAVGDKSGSAHGIWSNNKEHAGDFSFQDKRIFQVGLKVVTEAEISNEGFLSNDIVKQVVAQLEREEIEVKVPVTKIMENAVEIKRKVAGVDIVTVESEKAINTQVLECVTKVLKTAVESKRKVDVDKVTVKSEKAVECVTKVLESPVEIKRKVADVDKQIIESEKAIDTEVLQCVAKVTGIETESFVEIKSKGTIDSEKTVDIQLSESLTNVTESAVEIKRNVADADKGTIVMETAIDTQVSECVTKVTESAVQIMRKIANDDKKGSVERGKAVDTQVCVDISDIKMKRDVDSKMSEKASEAEMKIESKTDSASNCHDIPSDRKETEKSMTEIHESSFIRIKKSEDEENNLPVETETANDKERHGIYISYDTLGGKGDDKSEYDNNEDQIDYNEDKIDYNEDQIDYNEDKIDYNEDKIDYNEDKIDYNEDKIDYNEDKIDSNKDQSDYNKDQSKYNEDQSDYNEDNIDYHESDQDLTASDNSDLDEAKETEDLETVVRPIFLDGQMLCPGSGCLDQIYDSLKAFYKHWQAEHQLSVQRFECPSCSFKDVRKMEIRRHLKIDHSVRHRGVLEELMSLIKLESTTKTAEDSKPETSYKRKSNSQLKAKIKKQKMSFESDVDEKEDGKDTKDAGPKEENTVRVEIQISGESIKKLSPKKKVAWFFGMSCPVKNCNPRNFVSPREFHNHWENVHHPYLKKFECPICQYKNTQREMVGNHMILSHKAVKSNDVRELSEIKMVDVANPMYKDPGRFYFGDVSSMPTWNPDVKTMATTSPVQVTTLDTIKALVDSVKKSPSGNEKLGLKSLSSKSPAGEKELIKVVFISNMSCPVDKCGTRAFTSLSAFEDHWTKRHLPVREHFKCRICNFGNIAKTSTCMHIRNLHGMNHPEILQNIIKELDTNSQFLDPGPFYFEKCFTELAKAADKASDAKIASGIQKKEEKNTVRVEVEISSKSNEKLSPKKEKVVWFFGMSCPVKNCGPRNFVSPREFHNHWENVHHPYLKKFECPICQYKNTQREMVGNHMILSHKAVKSNDVRELSEIKMVDVTNPMYKDPGRFYFGDVSSMPTRNPDVKTMATTSPVQVTTLETSEALVDSVKKSPSGNEKLGLKTLSSKSPAGEKEPIKVVFISNMSCPVDKCGTRAFTSLSAFEDHWTKRHLPVREHFKCRICNFGNIAKTSTCMHIRNLHGMNHPEILQNIIKELDTNSQFLDPGPFYFEKCFTELAKAADKASDAKIASGIQKKEEKTGTDGIHELKEAKDTGTQANEESKKISKDPIPVKWVSGMSCPVINCGASYFMTFLSFRSHWENIHNLNVLKFKCPLCTFTNITKANIFAHLSVQHMLSDAMVKAKDNQIKTVKVKSNRYIDPGLYCFSEIEEVKQFQTDVTNTSPSEKKEMDLGADLKENIEKSKKITWMVGMFCPVKACGSETYLTIDSFSNHWIKTHHLVLKMFQCSQCAFKAIQTSEIENHLKSHHWILADKDVKAALTKIKAVKVLNPAFKDTEGYYFEPPDTEKEGECSLSNSENKSSEQDSNKMDLGADLKENIEKSKKITWMVGMFCPIKACGSETYLTIDSFSNHWIKTHHLELKMFQCSRCAFKAIQTSEIENHLKSHHWILADKDVKAALTKIKAVKVLNPAFKDTEGYHFEPPDTEKEGECSLSNSENKSSVQDSNESESTSENEMQKIVVEWKYNMTCPILKCDSRKYNSWTMYCQHWKMVHEQRYLKTRACPKCSYQNRQTFSLSSHMKHCHCLEGVELEKAAEEIRFVDVENPSFIDPGNYTCDWFGKSRESENSSTTSSSEIGKIVVSCRTLPRINEEPKWLYGPKPSPLQIPASTPMTVWIKVSGSANVEASSQMKAIEPAQKEQISPKKFKFSPGMPCPVKNCSPVRITSYSAFVEHWNEQHSLLLKKFACTLCDFKHIKKSIIFMHVRKEHGMPSHAVTKKITVVMENNVKAEELCELEIPTDHSRSIIMVKPDDSGQFDTNGGKIKEASYVVEELKKSDENIGKFDEHKDESEKDEKGQMHADTCAGLRDEKKSLESTQLEVVNRENVLTNNTAQGVYKSSDKDIKLRMSASEKQEKKEASSQKKAREPAEKEQRYPNKLTFVPGMPCPVKNCSPAWISSYSLLEHHWNERHGLMLKKFACTVCDFKDIQKSIVFMHVRIEHCLPSHVAAANITTVMVPNSQYVDADELYFPEFPTGDRKLIIKVKPDDSETGVFGEVLPDSSAEQPTLIKKVQMEARPLVSPKDEDMIEKKKHSVKGRVESIKDEVQTVMPSGSSDIPNVADDEDHISDFKEDSLNIDMSEFICIDEIGDEDANEESPEKQSAKETELLDDQEYEIQDEVSSPIEDHQIEDFLQNFVCIDDIGDEEGNEGC
ncbi:hypothetical protein CHS0354_012263 [Potamilus streckersoni]|uniref:C2H2-type domain-containing protein n=1 Tax=Potamilus streckersoni TaxID=2493646 RepID=A0AAE0SA50_9BIVA|nr:hypothetical protein CHS0354_012263 [Potamilus streckersoni]